MKARRTLWFAAIALIGGLLCPVAWAAGDFADNRPLPREFGSEAAGVEREGEAAAQDAATPEAGRIIGGIALVLLIGAGLIWFVRRNPSMRRYFGTDGAVRLITRLYLGSKTTVFLLKVGNRLIVVGSSSGGLRTLGEITDPVEVAALVAEYNDNGQRTGFKKALKESLSEAEKAGMPKRTDPREASVRQAPDKSPGGVDNDSTRRLGAIGHKLAAIRAGDNGGAR